MEKDIESTDSKEDTQPKLDLKFKEGQTIKVNLNISVSLFRTVCLMKYSNMSL